MRFTSPSTADSATAPINMLDWQAQQKALKDQERLSKTQTAELLHKYRGDTDDISSKLSTLKQEDRRSKEEAARLLHSYRGTAGILNPVTKSPQRPGYDMPEQGAIVDQRTGEESVAALAAGFNQNGAQEDVSLHQQQGRNLTESVMVDTPSPPVAVPDAEPAAAVPDVAPPVVAPQKIAPVATSSGTDDKAKASDDDWVSVESSTLPSPEKIEDMLAAPSGKELATDPNQGSFDSGEDTMSRAVTEKTDNLDDDDDNMDDDEDTVMTEAQLHASVSRGGHVSLRLDVEFSFGLISNDLVPNTDKYMKSVSVIAGSLFAERRPAGIGGHAIYNADFEPFVRFVEDDNTYSGQVGKRSIVHASLPMFIINWAEASSTREDVKNVLKNAVQDGSFLRLALESS